METESETRDGTRRGARGGFRPLDAAGLYARGVAMGAADIVPGVSGGTIALVTGIYERFVGALGSLSPAFLGRLARGDVKDGVREFRAMHWGVLVPLFLGILTAVALMSRLITGLMEDRPGATYAFFFGLILASAWAPFARMRRRTLAHALAAVIAAGTAWGIVGLRPSGLDVEARPAGGETAVWFYPGKLREPGDLERVVEAARAADTGARVVVFDPKGIEAGGELPVGVRRLSSEEELEAWSAGAAERGAAVGVVDTRRAELWWIFCCGAISISAMILPGLSGSFLMLLLGPYYAVLSAISRMPEHARALLGGSGDGVMLMGHTFAGDTVFLGVFGCGVVLGLGVFSRVVKWLFARAHDVTMAALTGLMLGALRLPGERVLESAGGAGGESWGLVIVVGAVGAALVIGLSAFDARARRGERADG